MGSTVIPPAMDEIRNVKPEDVIRIMKEHDQEISRNEAELILDFTYKFAKLAMDQTLKNEDCGPLYQGEY